MASLDQVKRSLLTDLENLEMFDEYQMVSKLIKSTKKSFRKQRSLRSSTKKELTHDTQTANQSSPITMFARRSDSGETMLREVQTQNSDLKYHKPLQIQHSPRMFGNQTPPESPKRLSLFACEPLTEKPKQPAPQD